MVSGYSWGNEMIEAVKSTVASSTMLKANADTLSATNGYAANPDKIQSVSQAPYVSPTVRVDVLTKIAILEFRESLSGEVLAQIPSENAIRTYKMREARGDAQLAAALTRKPEAGGEGSEVSAATKTPTPVQARETSNEPVEAVAQDAPKFEAGADVAV